MYMAINKHADNWYIATGKLANGVSLCGFGRTHTEALNDAFNEVIKFSIK